MRERCSSCVGGGGLVFHIYMIQLCCCGTLPDVPGRGEIPSSCGMACLVFNVMDAYVNAHIHNLVPRLRIPSRSSSDLVLLCPTSRRAECFKERIVEMSNG